MVMPIYKQDAAGKFVPFEEMPFPDLEKILEDWIETNPHLIFGDEEIAILARQPRTGYDKYLDLLGVDKAGATVVIELKRGETPRDVVAQTLEYAAWVDSLTLDQLDEMARDYGQKKGVEFDDLAGLYLRTFGDELEDEESEGGKLTQRITFNNRQRLVIMAERISDEVEQTLRYMRTRFGADVSGIAFSVHKSGNDTLISTTTVVGRERVSSTSQQLPQASERESDDHIRAKVKTDFMRDAVTAIEEWIDGLGVDRLAVEHSGSSEHYIRFLGVKLLYYYYANNWIYASMPAVTGDEVQKLRSRLSKPEELITKDHWAGDWRFHVAAPQDLDVLKEIILSRVKAKQEAASS